MNPDQIEVVGEPLDAVKRRFLRSIEDSPVKDVEGFQLIHGEAACTGCRNTVMSALIDMRNADQLMYLPGVTVLTGGAPIPGGMPIENVVTVGKCTPKEDRNERYVEGIWSELLGLEVLHATDNFIELGGHSLLTIRVIARIATETGVEFGPQDLFSRTLGSMAGQIDVQLQGGDKSVAAAKPTFWARLVRRLRSREHSR